MILPLSGVWERCVCSSIGGGSWRRCGGCGVFLRDGDVGGGGGRLGGWRVNDAVMGITNNWVAIVVELAAIRVVGKEFLEELFAGGWVLSLGAWFSITGR